MDYLLEYTKCKENIFYFIYNYIYLPEADSKLKITSKNLHRKIKLTIRSLLFNHKTVLMASRQLGKTTAAAIVLIWAMMFFPNTQAIILNMHQKSGYGNIQRIKDIYNLLPQWLIKISNAERNSRSERATYVDFKNGSKTQVFYPASNTDPETIARSLTAPILYIDEAAFINHLPVIYGAAQPVLSRARETAIKYNYPYFIFVTSTPNGTFGTGEWFYKMYLKSTDILDLVDDNDDWIPNSQELLTANNKNSFIFVKYLWNEDPTKTVDWYETQKRELNDPRRVTQELDLLFLGAQKSVFDDVFLKNALESVNKKPVTMELKHGVKLRLFENIAKDKHDYFIVGVDNAKSLDGDFCAIEIYRYSDFKQVGEFFGKIGSLTLFAQAIEDLVKFFTSFTDNLIVGIEENNIGNTVVEYFEHHSDPNLLRYFYVDDDKDEIGINTNVKSKFEMISYFFDYIKNSPELIQSQDLVNQFNIIERKANGSISARSGYHDDLFMASCLCAYIRKKTEFEILPKIVKTVKTKINKEHILKSNVSTKGIDSVNYLNKLFNDNDKIMDNVELFNELGVSSPSDMMISNVNEDDDNKDNLGKFNIFF